MSTRSRSIAVNGPDTSTTSTCLQFSLLNSSVTNSRIRATGMDSLRPSLNVTIAASIAAQENLVIALDAGSLSMGARRSSWRPSQALISVDLPRFLSPIRQFET